MKRTTGIAGWVAVWVAVCGPQSGAAAETADSPVPAVVPAAAPAAAVPPAGERVERVHQTGTNVMRETTITSERIEFDYKEFVAVFDENVKVDNPQFLLTADRVVVFLEGTNQVRQIMALGHVTLSNEQRVASCDKAVYTRQNGQVVMTGTAQLRRAGDRVSGDRIIIWLDDQRMEVSPGHFVIAPETLRPKPKQADTNAPAQP